MPGVDHIILNCNNYEESKRFYRKQGNVGKRIKAASLIILIK